ncbi:MAG TPA: two-component regulator propeller domain-containing protein [Chitinophagaceae bacterium]|nr:two-component regulator propeller domain-containing protein [Chitinophagaceae bacterium]
MNRRPLYIIVLLALCAVTQAQNKQYVFNRLSVKDGLASNYVFSILQDKKGFMWFGTASGLQRYDGRKIISFRPPPSDTSYLPAEPITQLLLDKKERFWVRTGKEVGLFNTATFSYKRIPIEIPRQDMESSELRLFEDKAGNIFLILSFYGILVYDEQTRSFKKNSKIIDVPAGTFVTGFQQDPKDGNYWIATVRGMVFFHRKHRRYFTHHDNPIQQPDLKNPLFAEPVTSFFIDSARRFWISTWNCKKKHGRLSLFYSDRNKLVSPVTIRLAKPLYYEVHFMRQQRNGHIWMHGLSMLAEFNEATQEFRQHYNETAEDFGIRYDAVHCFYEDRENNVWLATDQGIYVFNPDAQRFTSISMVENSSPTDIGDRSITSFMQTEKEGDIWMSTWGQGIFAYDTAFRLKQNRIYQGVLNDKNFYMTWSMLEHQPSGKIWIGCQAGRLMLHNPKTQQTEYYNLPVFNHRTIRAITQDKQGNVWLGTQHGRLMKWDASKGRRRFSDGFQLVHKFSSHIYKVRQDEEGFIWTASHFEGVTVFDPSGNIVKQYNNKGGPGRSLFRNQVSDILFYNDSLVVIGAGVLNILNRKTGAIHQITSKEGLPGNSVSSVEKDDDGNLWIGLTNGLCRYNMKRYIFTLFSQKDGIVRNEFHDGDSYRLKDGRLIFSNPHDFVFFNPAQILPSSPPPDVSITDFKLFDNYLPPDSILQLDRVNLDYNQNSITIEFAALSFLQKDKMVYYTKMEGVDKDWNLAGSYNIANYSLLAAGDYTFKVRCENGDGLSSRNVTSLRIHIRPPFWQEEWFIMICMMAIAGLIYLAHRMRIRQLMEMEKVRGRIAHDLHDDMGSTLSTINILSEMARMKVDKDTQKTSEYISKISDNSHRMMEAMDDIVWSINPVNDSMQRITARMREFATGLLEAKNIDVEFKVDEVVNNLTLDMESRRDLFLIFKEAVNNIAKYSGCTHVVIEIQVHGPRLVMSIRDNGKGFDVQQADSGNGLTNMKKRAQSLKGRLDIDSVQGVGTKVRLEAPLT